ncbi:snaclec stejaggregin-B subunit beta-1-like [Fundulus heteroclitus]|uniref:snaclec stejaggregin-B subunit beta-1-like n=1 Tax=Fundulus heteroclitus TaxID=8078 RepID=UPI00165BE0A4|nr:snaclec stejaggregin-B subunit beta-1-like [Fundulus heteroclitus]
MRAVQEKKTWEDALEFCREQHTDLTSLLSVTENHLAEKEIQSADFTDQVWVGIRYLGDTWMWVNGDPLLYEAWQQDGDLDHQCPMLKRCGALTKNGVWEARDCQEKLSFICV